MSHTKRKVRQTILGVSDMDGKLLNAKEASKVLFGSDSKTNYQRTLRLGKQNKIKTITDGRRMFFIKDDILKIVGASDNPRSTL